MANPNIQASTDAWLALLIVAALGMGIQMLLKSDDIKNFNRPFAMAILVVIVFVGVFCIIAQYMNTGANVAT